LLINSVFNTTFLEFLNRFQVTQNSDVRVLVSVYPYTRKTV
jgi:hypothetical protein